MESTTGKPADAVALQEAVTTQQRVLKRATPAARMAKLARAARARGYHWTAFYSLYAAAVVEGDREAGFQLADVLIALRPTQMLPEIDEAFRLALETPW